MQPFFEEYWNCCAENGLLQDEAQGTHHAGMGQFMPGTVFHSHETKTMAVIFPENHQVRNVDASRYNPGEALGGLSPGCVVTGHDVKVWPLEKVRAKPPVEQAMSEAGSASSPEVRPDVRPEIRIDGWKEIAVYLGRGERTVKRWEADRGLPIHRVPGGGRASVHAYNHELDSWLKSNRDTEPDSPDLLPLDEPQAHQVSEPNISSADSPLPALSTPTSKPPRWFMVPLLITSSLVLCIGVLGFSHGVRAKSIVIPSKATETVSDSEKATARALYLTGRFEWNKRTPESLNRALDAFTQSIVHDPTAAPAYAGLADTYVLLREYSMIPAQEAYTRAIAAATKAVELDDSLAEAHRSLGFAETWGNWDFRDGQRELRRAVELNPQDPLSHLWLATAFEAPEWYAVTAHEFQLAQELDPSSKTTLVNKSIWLFDNGHRQEGLDLAHQVEQSDPDFVAAHRYLAYMDWDQRNYRDFLAESKTAAELQHDPLASEVTEEALKAFQRGGEQEFLQSLYLSRKKQHEDGKLSGMALAAVCLRLGKNEEAFQLADEDIAQHRAGLEILTAPDFLALREDPRYQAIRARIAYPTP